MCGRVEASPSSGRTFANQSVQRRLRTGLTGSNTREGRSTSNPPRHYAIQSAYMATSLQKKEGKRREGNINLTAESGYSPRILIRRLPCHVSILPAEQTVAGQEDQHLLELILGLSAPVVELGVQRLPNACQAQIWTARSETPYTIVR